jgi:hypothetical protein
MTRSLRRDASYQSLRLTPATEAGAADHVSSLEEIIGLLPSFAVNLTELKSALVKAGIPELPYSFTSNGTRDEEIGDACRISFSHDMLGDRWEVYYVERGEKRDSDMVVHRSESDACEDLYRRIMRAYRAH